MEVWTCVSGPSTNKQQPSVGSDQCGVLGVVLCGGVFLSGAFIASPFLSDLALPVCGIFGGVIDWLLLMRSIYGCGSETCYCVGVFD